VVHPKKREIPTFSRYVFRCYFCCTPFQKKSVFVKHMFSTMDEVLHFRYVNITLR
jgi:hypothetical protein